MQNNSEKGHIETDFNLESKFSHLNSINCESNFWKKSAYEHRKEIYQM